MTYRFITPRAHYLLFCDSSGEWHWRPGLIPMTTYSFWSDL